MLATAIPCNKYFILPQTTTFAEIILLQLQLSLQAIQETATAKQEQNDRFIQHLKQLNQEELDAEVQRLDQLISPQISCTDCGNCCKGLMVNITAEEADRASAHLHMSREAFDEKYVEK